MEDDIMACHEVSNIFPMMDRDEYRKFLKDIDKNGLRDPIWIYEGEIIDGRNRYKACLDLGIKPEFKTWDGKGSLVEFVVSMNLHRRHLNSSQRATIAAEIEPVLAEEAR